MKMTFAALATAGLFLVPLAAQAAEPTVKEINVVADMSAVQNPAAAAYWGQLEGDLESAILARITNQIADDGAKLTIDISEIELANGFQEATGIADAQLKGTVNQTHDSNNARFQNYAVSVDVKTVLPILGEGFVLTAPDVDTKKIYDAMISAFADEVVRNIR